jgi:chromate transporter
MISLGQLSLVFFKMGLTSFGGPAAHIALMEEEVVRRRQWISHEEFLDLLGATNLIPGPNSTEMAIHIGHRMGGWRGLIVAGVSFITPAFLIVWAAAWFYVQYGSLPAVRTIFQCVLPVILAVIAQAVLNLSKSAIKNRTLGVLCALSLLLFLTEGHEILILFSVAAANMLVHVRQSPKSTATMLVGITTAATTFAHRAWAQIQVIEKAPALDVFGYFAKVGSVLFGSGYVLIAFLKSDLVDRLQWLTQQQLVDAVAIGQFTPGPVFTTATFIGYLVSGHQGAWLATLGIFAPAFFFVAISAPWIPKMRASAKMGHFLDGLNVASLGMMAGAAFLLAKGVTLPWLSLGLFAVSLYLLIRYRLNSAWLILAAGAVGFFI